MIILNLIVSLYHLLLAVVLILVLLISTNMKYLLICFGLMVYIKILHLYFGFCILTEFEKK
jgi:hypothetical protein